MTVSSEAAKETAARQAWMAVLARATPAELETALVHLSDLPAYVRLRGPETGLVMARGRAGGNGQVFNLGEVTVTRATIRLESGEIGQAYVQGRHHRGAELAAFFDALLQTAKWSAPVDRQVIEPVIRRLAAAKAAREAKVAATKVDFFTMVRGED
ncbi:MAG: phosphonate C-P lyase system protein PhnG [Rhodospirillales bacterium]